MNDNPKPMSDAELVGMMQRNQKSLREQIERLETERDKLREQVQGWQMVPDSLQKLGKRLAELLDEDQFAECEALLLAEAPKPPVQEPVYSGRIVPASTALIQWAWEDEPESTLFDEGYNAARRWVKMQLEYAVSKAPQPSDGVAKDDWTPSDYEYDRSIHHNPDATAWAEFFVATFPALKDKEDLMHSWFANAMMAMHDHLKNQPAQDDAKDALVVAASAALLEIECLMKEAYNSATPVCCQRAGQECCGDYLPEWSEYDQRTMDRFAPHQRALNEALRAIDAAMGSKGDE